MDPPAEGLADTRGTDQEQAEGATRELDLRFVGDGREYFRIWVVNAFLSLVTLGTYSAWAKVRRKRYLYSHTILDGTPFQYLARPIPILKGRLIAVAVATTYYLSTYLQPGTLPYVIAFAIPFLPLLLRQSLAFNARNSAYRALTLRFEASYGRAACVALLGGPGLVFALGALTGAVPELYLAGIAGLSFVTFPWWQKALRRFVVEHSSFGGQPGEMRARAREFLWIYVRAGFVMLGGGLVLLAAVVPVVLALEAATGQDHQATIVPLVLGYGGTLLMIAYVRARTANLVWNATRLGPLRFHSTIRARKLMGIYLTNAVGILCSLGLLVPWAEVRTQRYRMECLRAFLDGSEHVFRGTPADNVSAVGSEVGDVFDLDVSL